MATIPVKYLHSGMTGAPVLSGTAGALLAILDACLLNGFGLKAVDSLVVSGDVATATISSGHSAEVGCVIAIAGATPSSLNGEWRVTNTTTTTVQFATSGISDQTASGTISLKLAPLNWSKAYSGTNLAAYKSANVYSPGHLLRVDDTGTIEARVVGYESMSDINTGTGAFPTSSQMSGGLYWQKSNTANTTARNWIVIGDDRLFYFWCVSMDATSVTTQGRIVAFGDPDTLSTTDTYSTILTGFGISGGQYPADFTGNNGYSTGNPQMCSPRTYSGIGGAIQQSYFHEYCAIGDTTNRQSGAGLLTFPNGPDNGLLLSKGLVFVGSNLRSRMPGIYVSPQWIGFSLSTKDVVFGQGEFSGKRLYITRQGTGGGGQGSTSGTYGCTLFDVTGPWR